MIQIRSLQRSDRAFLVRLVAQDTDPIPALLGITPKEIARGAERIFGLPVWWALTLTRWFRIPLARLLVAEYDGTPAGFVSVGFERGHRRIGTLITDSSHRRRGIASALMDAAETAARDRGGRVAALEVNQENEAALSVYLRRGYRTLFVIHWFEGSLSEPPVRDGDGRSRARRATKADLRGIRSLRASSLPASLLRVLPRANEDPANIDRFAKSRRGEHGAWCIGPPGAPSGLVRAYTSAKGGVSFLSFPYLDSSAGEAQQDVLLNEALAWLSAMRATRTVSGVPGYSTQVLATLRRGGFVERLRSDFMARELP